MYMNRLCARPWKVKLWWAISGFTAIAGFVLAVIRQCRELAFSHESAILNKYAFLQLINRGESRAWIVVNLIPMH